jgi:hypothetical protein
VNILKYREKYNFKEGKCLNWIIMNWLFGDAKTIREGVKCSFGEGFKNFLFQAW